MRTLFVCFAVQLLLFDCAAGQGSPTDVGSEQANEFCLACSSRRNSKDLYAAADDCHAFYQCLYVNETLAIGIRRQCPPRQFWHETHLTCVPEGSTPCLDLCRDPDVATTGCYADPAGNCATYFMCSNQVSYQFCCPPTTTFSADSCGCIDDLEGTCTATCSLPPATPTTVKPPTVINSTMCQDSFGNFLRPVTGFPNLFEHVNTDGQLNEAHTLACAPGTAFDVTTCACDILQQPLPQPLHQCSLYLPFDGSVQDASVTHAFTMPVGKKVELNYDTSAHGIGSLLVYGGWLEVPVFKSLDMGSSASWCFFFKCGTNPLTREACKKGGLLSNNNNDLGTDFSIIVAATSANHIDVRLAFKNPESQVESESEIIYLNQQSNFTQVCVVYDTTFVYVYIDQVMVSSMPVDGKNLRTAHCPMTLGSDQIFGEFYGFIDEVLVCPFALSPEEVGYHFRGGNVLAEAGLVPGGQKTREQVPQYGSVDAEWLIWCEQYSVPCNRQDSKDAFAASLDYIKHNNELYKKGLVPNVLALNKFSGMTKKERDNRFGLVFKGGNYELKPGHKLRGGDCSKLPLEWDWCRNDSCTDVKDQGDCGACWAFSAVGAIEGAMGKAGLPMVELSMQQLVSCSHEYGNMGCRGGLMTQAFDFIASLSYEDQGLITGGLNLLEHTPYKGLDSEECTYNEHETCAGPVFNYRETIGDECNLALDLMNYGPLSIGMEITDEFIHNEKGQIYRETQCHRPKPQLNHGMLLVGFGTDENGVKFWRIKNSWGKKWCEDGFIRVLRGDRDKPNQCGICNLVSSPILLLPRSHSGLYSNDRGADYTTNDEDGSGSGSGSDDAKAFDTPTRDESVNDKWVLLENYTSTNP